MLCIALLAVLSHALVKQEAEEHNKVRRVPAVNQLAVSGLASIGAGALGVVATPFKAVGNLFIGEAKRDPYDFDWDATTTFEERWNDFKHAVPHDELQPLCLPTLEGPPTGRLVILLHGFSSCPGLYEQYVQDLIDRGFQVMRVVLPGHGRKWANKETRVALKGKVFANEHYVDPDDLSHLPHDVKVGMAMDFGIDWPDYEHGDGPNMGYDAPAREREAYPDSLENLVPDTAPGDAIGDEINAAMYREFTLAQLGEEFQPPAYKSPGEKAADEKGELAQFNLEELKQRVKDLEEEMMKATQFSMDTVMKHAALKQVIEEAKHGELTTMALENLAKVTKMAVDNVGTTTTKLLHDADHNNEVYKVQSKEDDLTKMPTSAAPYLQFAKAVGQLAEGFKINRRTEPVGENTVVIVGHSLGGLLTAKASLDYGEFVDRALIMNPMLRPRFSWIGMTPLGWAWGLRVSLDGLNSDAPCETARGTGSGGYCQMEMQHLQGLRQVAHEIFCDDWTLCDFRSPPAKFANLKKLGIMHTIGDPVVVNDRIVQLSRAAAKARDEYQTLCYWPETITHNYLNNRQGDKLWPFLKKRIVNYVEEGTLEVAKWVDGYPMCGMESTVAVAGQFGVELTILPATVQQRYLIAAPEKPLVADHAFSFQLDLRSGLALRSPEQITKDTFPHIELVNVAVDTEDFQRYRGHRPNASTPGVACRRASSSGTSDLSEDDVGTKDVSLAEHEMWLVIRDSDRGRNANVREVYYIAHWSPETPPWWPAHWAASYSATCASLTLVSRRPPLMLEPLRRDAEDAELVTIICGDGLMAALEDSQEYMPGGEWC